MDILWKAAVTLASGAILLMFGDYIRFRLRIAREMVTRSDCASCQEKTSNTNQRIFEKLEDLATGVSRIEGKLEG